MEWQPESAGRAEWFREAGGHGRHEASPGTGTGGGARGRRWVLHGGHGGGGAVSSSSQGPHITPDPGASGR